MNDQSKKDTNAEPKGLGIGNVGDRSLYADLHKKKDKDEWQGEFKETGDSNKLSADQSAPKKDSK